MKYIARWINGIVTVSLDFKTMEEAQEMVFLWMKRDALSGDYDARYEIETVKEKKIKEENRS